MENYYNLTNEENEAQTDNLPHFNTTKFTEVGSKPGLALAPKTPVSSVVPPCSPVAKGVHDPEPKDAMPSVRAGTTPALLILYPQFCALHGTDTSCISVD